jgi:hypothetical protein
MVQADCTHDGYTTRDAELKSRNSRQELFTYAGQFGASFVIRHKDALPYFTPNGNLRKREKKNRKNRKERRTKKRNIRAAC